MKYDDASWHYGGDFPDHLPESAGGTHIGIFVAFMLLSGFGGTIHTHDDPQALEQLSAQKSTPGQWFLEICDGKFTDEDLSASGNAFAKAYYVYNDEEDLPRSVSYLKDYEAVFPESEWLYDVEDSCESFSRLKPVLDARLGQWRTSNGIGA